MDERDTIQRERFYLHFMAEGSGARRGRRRAPGPTGSTWRSWIRSRSGLLPLAGVLNSPHPGKALLSNWSVPNLVPPTSSELRQDTGGGPKEGDPSPAWRA